MDVNELEIFRLRVDIFRTFVIHLLFHMHQKKKIKTEIAAKIENVNKSSTSHCYNSQLLGYLYFKNSLIIHEENTKEINV
jgi:hypothetical protein